MTRSRSILPLLLPLAVALQLLAAPLAAAEVCWLRWLPDAGCCGDAEEAAEELAGGCCGEAPAPEDPRPDDDSPEPEGCACELDADGGMPLPAPGSETRTEGPAALVPALGPPVAPARTRARPARRAEVGPPAHGPPRHVLFGVFLI